MPKKTVDLDAFKVKATVERLPAGLELVYDKFKRSLGASLSMLTRKRATVDYISSSLIRGDEILKSLPPKACFEVVDMQKDGKKIPAVFVFEEPLLALLIEVFFGDKKAGQQKKSDVKHADLTTLDTVPARQIVDLAMPALQDAWKDKSEVKMSFKSTELDAKQLGIFLPATQIVSSAFEIRFEEKMGIFLFLMENPS